MFSKSALVSFVLGVLYVNALAVPVARQPAPELEFQDLMARVNFISDNLFSRGPESLAQWAEGVRNQASKREPLKLTIPGTPGSPRLPPRITVTPPTPTTPTRARDLSGDLFLREPEVSSQLVAREPLRISIPGTPGSPRPPPRITVTPPTPTTPTRARDLSDDLISREQEDWSQLAKRDPLKITIPGTPGSPRPPPRITVTPPTPTTPTRARDLSDDLTLREPEVWSQLVEREPLKITIPGTPGSPRPPPRITVTPPTPTTPTRARDLSDDLISRELSDDLTSRGSEEWSQLVEREPLKITIPGTPGSPRPPPRITVTPPTPTTPTRS